MVGLDGLVSSVLVGQYRMGTHSHVSECCVSAVPDRRVKAGIGCVRYGLAVMERRGKVCLGRVRFV